jgi:hypothetical protein
MTWILRSVQWVAAAIATLALLVTMVPVAEAQEDEAPDEELLADDDIRTDAGAIAGYRVEASATPVTVRIFEPTIPLPVEPGQPHLEFSAAFAATNLGAGPVSRAVGSVVWPGYGVGDGWGTFMGEFGGDPDSEYPLRASAQYPSGPDEEEVEAPGGGGMSASARGLDVRAVSTFSDEIVPDLFTAETMRSVTTSTVEDDLAKARARSVVEGLEVLGDIVRVDEMRVDLRASSDGVTGEDSGAFAISGLEVMGVQYVVDNDGVRVDEEAEEDGDGGFLDGGLNLPLGLGGDIDLQELIGVRVEVVPQDEEDEEQDEAGPGAARAIEGLRITLDFDPLLSVARDLPIRDVIGELPREIQEQVALLLGLTTKVEIALGSASVAAEATEPFDLDGGGDLPDAPDGLDGSDVADMGDMPSTTDGAGFDEAGTPSTGSDDFAAPETAPAPGGEEQAAAPEVAQQFEQARSVPDLFGGLPAPLVMLTAGLIGAAAWGLQRLTGAAMSGTALGGAACPDAGDGVPDLRSWTQA